MSSMLSTGRDYLRSQCWMSTFPGRAIMLTVMAVHLLGDSLRDALDPRLRICNVLSSECNQADGRFDRARVWCYAVNVHRFARNCCNDKLQPGEGTAPTPDPSHLR